MGILTEDGFERKKSLSDQIFESYIFTATDRGVCSGDRRFEKYTNADSRGTGEVFLRKKEKNIQNVANIPPHFRSS